MTMDKAKKAMELCNRLDDIDGLKREAFAAGSLDKDNPAVKDLFRIADAALNKLEQITKSQIFDLS